MGKEDAKFLFHKVSSLYLPWTLIGVPSGTGDLIDRRISFFFVMASFTRLFCVVLLVFSGLCTLLYSWYISWYIYYIFLNIFLICLTNSFPPFVFPFHTCCSLDGASCRCTRNVPQSNSWEWELWSFKMPDAVLQLKPGNRSMHSNFYRSIPLHLQLGMFLARPCYHRYTRIVRAGKFRCCEEILYL